MSKAKLALWLFILSTLFSGVVWEAVGWISLIYCCKLAKSNRFTTIKKESVPEITIVTSRVWICYYAVLFTAVKYCKHYSTVWNNKNAICIAYYNTPVKRLYL